MSTSTEIQIFTPADLQSAGSILTQNTSFVSKYEAKSKVLLATAAKEGVKLTPETDAAINAFLVSAKTCLKKMEEDRKPFTQKLQEFVKLFTTQENVLSKGIYPKLQAIRDASATAYAKEEAEKRRLEQLELDKEKERINLFTNVEAQLRAGYAKMLAEDKSLLLANIENATSENIDEVERILTEINPTLTEDRFSSDITIRMSSELLTKSEMEAIFDKACDGKFEKILPHYISEIKNYATHLLTLIPGRREEIAKGEASRAAEELRKKEEAQLVEQQRLAEERAKEVASKKIADAVVDTQVGQVARTASMPNAKTIESYSITVLKVEGWAEIFKFYLTHSEDSVEDLGNVKLNQMKAFAERKAKSTGEKIISDALEYDVKYKATARKAA